MAVIKGLLQGQANITEGAKIYCGDITAFIAVYIMVFITEYYGRFLREKDLPNCCGHAKKSRNSCPEFHTRIVITVSTSGFCSGVAAIELQELLHADGQKASLG
jgi:hypothetical protein